MIDEAAKPAGSCRPDEEGQAQGALPSSRVHVRGKRKWRGPTPAELALLRWLAPKPRPVSMGPVGHCVKKGWCAPVRSVVEDELGPRPGTVYVVTDAGLQLLRDHAAPSGGEPRDAGADRPGTEAGPDATEAAAPS